MKDRQRGLGTFSCPTAPFLSPILLSPSHILLISCIRSFHFVLSCALSKSHTCMHTNMYPYTDCHEGGHILFLLSQGCRTIAILHQPFRNLLSSLFQWCGPEALVLQLCHIVYMIKYSICSYISWANSDKCYQSSYFSE